VQLADRVGNRVVDFIKIPFHSGNHGWGAADQNFAISSIGIRKVLLDVVLGNEAGTASPDGRGVVEDVVDFKSAAVGR